MTLPTIQKPSLRFKEFTDNWKQYIIADLLEERNTQVAQSVEYPLMAFVAYYGVVEKGERYNREFLVNDIYGKKYKQTEKGDFIYSSNNLETGSIGLNKYGKAVISPVYSIFKPTNISDSNFIGFAFQRKKFINSMIKWRQGVIYGQWKIHEKDFLNIETLAPTKKEQIKIGDFFSNIDDRISLQQQKVDRLTNIKKSLLQKMFPKNGQNTPEIRFKDFDEAWGQQDLASCALLNKGSQLSKKDMLAEGTYYVLNGGINPSGFTNEYNTNENTISISEGGNSCGYVNFNSSKFWSGGHNYTLTQLKLETNYLYQFLKSKESTIMALRVGSGLPNIQKNSLNEINIFYPSNKEQKKIGDFLSYLNDLISLNQDKLDKLKKLKKACLKNMFV